MIAYLRGEIIDQDERSLTILCNNVGYKVFVANCLLAELGSMTEIDLFIQTIVREDAFNLYGFGSKNDLRLFELLITVKGIGPKVALDMLSAPREMIVNAISGQNPDLLSRIKGIGKKTAERIVVELKNKISDLALITNNNNTLSINHGIIDALEGLGYSKPVIYDVLRDKPENMSEEEEVLRWFLQNV